jgi:dimethylaniline monooxygenase (N-oxide forming)
VSLRYRLSSLQVADLVIQYLLESWCLGCGAVCQFFVFSIETLSLVSETMFQNFSLAVWKDDVANWLDSDAELEFINVVDEGKSVHVARTSITKVDSKTVTLSNRETVECDAIIFATGWEPSTTELFIPALKAELGLQFPVTHLEEEEAAYWRGLEASADKQVLDIYPMLANPPSGIRISPELETPHRMLRGIIPPKLAAKGDRSIIFLGQLITVQHCTIGEVGSLWGIAYLEGMLPLGNQEAMDREIALMNRFMKRRYPGRRNVPFVVGEVRDWMDMMLKDLGVRTDRNRLAYERSPDEGWGWFGWKAWWKEWFLPYEPAVYQGIVQEFLEMFRTNPGESKKLR